MGAMQQLLALPVACMLFALARAGGAKVAAGLLRNAIATIALRNAAPARWMTRVAPVSTAIARVIRRGVRPSAWARATTTAHHAPSRGWPVGGKGGVVPMLSVRRIRSRRAMANFGSI